MKTTVILRSWLPALMLACTAMPADKESAGSAGLEVSAKANPERARVGERLGIEITVKNVSKEAIRLGHYHFFLQTFDVRGFDLTRSEPLALTAHGREQKKSMRRKYAEIVLRPGEQIQFTQPMLARDFDLSRPGRYRLEIGFFPSTVQPANAPPIRAISLAVEFEIEENPTIGPMVPAQSRYEAK
jgi:hypothetical protein